MFDSLKRKLHDLRRELTYRPASMVMLDHVSKGIKPPQKVLDALLDRNGPQIGALLLVPGSRWEALRLLALAVREDPENALAILYANLTPSLWWVSGGGYLDNVDLNPKPSVPPNTKFQQHPTTPSIPRPLMTPPSLNINDELRIVIEMRATGPNGEKRPYPRVYVGTQQVGFIESVILSTRLTLADPDVVISIGAGRIESYPEQTRMAIRNNIAMLRRFPFVKIITNIP